MVVRIDVREKHGQRLWQVRAGRRCLIFQDEFAARQFAAQLQLRMQWLAERRNESPAAPATTPETQRPEGD